MSDEEIIVRTLARVRRRLKMRHAVHDACLLLCLGAVGVLLWRGLRLAGDHLPAASAVAVLMALLLWTAGLIVLVRRVLVRRTDLACAAAEADRRAALDDELKTAYWFIVHPAGSAWTAAQRAAAARSAGGLDVARLMPLRIERSTLAASGLVTALVLALWFAPPVLPSSPGLPQPASDLSAGEARQMQLLRELTAELPGDPAAAAQVERALRTLTRKEVSAEERQRALSAAREALEQRNVEAASTREGLYRLAQRLHGSQALQEVARALEEGDARKAAQALQQLSGAQAGSAVAAKPTAERDEKDLQRLLEQAAARGAEESAETSSVAAKEAIDRLNQIAAQLDAQQQLNQAAQALQQLQLAVAQRSTMSAGRFGQQAAQNSTPSPTSGQTSMPGGVMFRSAAVAQEQQASAQQEGSKTGAALGESPADAPLGNKATTLGVQLQKEGISGEPEDQQEAARNWFYAESKEQRATVELRDVQARERFAQAQSGTAEGISVRHRQIVKDYFMHLREGKP